MTEQNKPIRVGSRKSELALIQTKHVISQLQKLYPEICFEIHTMSTIGDRVLNVSLPKIGEKSLFTRDLEDALRNGNVDFVVHSLKDLPTALPSGMAIGAVLEREDSRDALVLNEKYKGKTIDSLPPGCVIGTSSLRRTAQLRRLYPHLEVCDIRGNLNTRLAKLDAPNSKFAGIILAQAGLLRMGWMNRISQILEPDHLFYAVGQGALAVECRSNDEEILSMLQNLMCLSTACRILAERSFLKTLGGGCSAPVAVSTELNGALNKNNDENDDVSLNITGAVWSLDGTIEIKENTGCCLKLNKKRKESDKEKEEDEVGDNDEDSELPRKKVKVDNSDDENFNKQDSPKIVNDDKFNENLKGDSENGGIKIPDLQYLINIHGELFKKCPFYAQHEKDRENGNSSLKKDECPLNIPIGQDFMGKCPYVDTPHKVEMAEIFDNICPKSGNLVHKENDDILAQGDSVKIKQKCPFTSKTDKNNQNIIDNELGHNVCPFIQKNLIKMIDYDEEKLKMKDIKSAPAPPVLIDDSVNLFCGLYRHKCYRNELFAKCEELGRHLAENLINKGALDVMKCAQQEIREKS